MAIFVLHGNMVVMAKSWEYQFKGGNGICVQPDQGSIVVAERHGRRRDVYWTTGLMPHSFFKLAKSLIGLRFKGYEITRADPETPEPSLWVPEVDRSIETIDVVDITTPLHASWERSLESDQRYEVGVGLGEGHSLNDRLISLMAHSGTIAVQKEMPVIEEQIKPLLARR